MAKDDHSAAIKEINRNDMDSAAATSLFSLNPWIRPFNKRQEKANVLIVDDNALSMLATVTLLQ